MGQRSVSPRETRRRRTRHRHLGANLRVVDRQRISRVQQARKALVEPLLESVAPSFECAEQTAAAMVKADPASDELPVRNREALSVSPAALLALVTRPRVRHEARVAAELVAKLNIREVPDRG